MFGYVRPPLGLLDEEERARFRGMYCGLCHTLANRYGPVARWILNYDFTFLAILLSEGGEKEGAGRCVAHPFRKRACLEGSPALELAADESVILAWWQLRDGVEDHGAIRRLPWQGGAALLEHARGRAAALRPGFDGAVRRRLETLRELEEARCASIDRPADVFARLLRGAAEGVTETARRRVLEQILYHLGRWIYLIDAADDLKRDARSGNYNPVALRFALTDGVWTETARSEFALTLDHSIHQMAAAFELWDFGVWRPILEATFYSGLFQVGRSVLDGTFHRTTRKLPDAEPDRKRETG